MSFTTCCKVAIGLLVILCSTVASADSIKVGDKTYDFVYIGQDASFYYIHVPSSGEIVKTSKFRHDVRGYTKSDPATRDRLLAEWKDKKEEIEDKSPKTAANSMPSEEEIIENMNRVQSEARENRRLEALRIQQAIEAQKQSESSTTVIPKLTYPSSNFGITSYSSPSKPTPLFFPEGGSRDWSDTSGISTENVWGIFDVPTNPILRDQYFDDMEKENERLSNDLSSSQKAFVDEQMKLLGF